MTPGPKINGTEMVNLRAPYLPIIEAIDTVCKYQLHHIWDEVLFNTPDLHLK